MPLSSVTREAVLAAIHERHRLGADAFLERYGFGPAREYSLILNRRQYASKAIAGAAHGFARPDLGPLRASDFSGGDATVKRLLERLGFVVQRTTVAPLPPLKIGQVYLWDELGEAFRFNPQLFQVGGGMLSRPDLNALLLITHPGGARSFDYEDRWDGTTLIYTGRGKSGDQRLEGQNRDVADTANSSLSWKLLGRNSFDTSAQRNVHSTGLPAASTETVPIETSTSFDSRLMFPLRWRQHQRRARTTQARFAPCRVDKSDHAARTYS